MSVYLLTNFGQIKLAIKEKNPIEIQITVWYVLKL